MVKVKVTRKVRNSGEFHITAATVSIYAHSVVHGSVISDSKLAHLVWLPREQWYRWHKIHRFSKVERTSTICKIQKDDRFDSCILYIHQMQHSKDVRVDSSGLLYFHQLQDSTIVQFDSPSLFFVLQIRPFTLTRSVLIFLLRHLDIAYFPMPLLLP